MVLNIKTEFEIKLHTNDGHIIAKIYFTEI